MPGVPITVEGSRGRWAAHLQGLHQAPHLVRLQLRRDGPDEDAHGHVVHGRDVLRVDALVPGLSHGCCRPELASSFLLRARLSAPLHPEQGSAQPGPFTSSRPGHRHRHRHRVRPEVLQSHSEGAGQAAGPVPALPGPVPTALRPGEAAGRAEPLLRGCSMCWGSLLLLGGCPGLSAPAWPCGALSLSLQHLIGAEMCPHPSLLH